MSRHTAAARTDTLNLGGCKILSGIGVPASELARGKHGEDPARLRYPLSFTVIIKM